MTATLILFTIGLTIGSRETYTRVRDLRTMYALRRTTRSKELRRQILIQHDAQERVRRATTLDPWLGRGGTHLFREI